MTLQIYPGQWQENQESAAAGKKERSTGAPATSQPSCGTVLPLGLLRAALACAVLQRQDRGWPDGLAGAGTGD